MKKPPRTEQHRNGQYYYRLRVPGHLIDILGFKEFRESLRTGDMNVARVRAVMRDAQVTVVLQMAEAQLKAAKPSTAPLTMSPAALLYIRDAVAAHTLKQDDDFRRSNPDEDSREHHDSFAGDMFEATGKALAQGVAFTNADERSRVVEALQAVGIDIPQGTPEWLQAAFKATEGQNVAMQAVYKRTAGEYVPTPPAPLRPVQGVAASTDGLTLGKVAEGYLATLKQSGYTRKIRRCLQLLLEMVGAGTAVTDLKQKAITGFLRDICKLPTDWATQFDRGVSVAALLVIANDEGMSPTTYRDNYRAPLKAFLSDSLRDHGDEGFPALTVERVEYVGVRKANEDQQRSLGTGELKSLLEGPEFALVAKDPEQEALYWFTALSLLTGARPRELCQVNPQVDFGQLDDIWYIDLSPHSAAGKGIIKTIKTGEERRIPLHPELVRLGLPAYLERMKAEGADRLFPSFRVKKGNPFEAAGDIFTALLKGAGLYDNAAPPGRQVLGAYVMRKTFITMCRNQGVVSMEITGHSDGTTTVIQDRHYIFGPEPLHRKHEVLKKLLVPVKIPSR